MRIAYLCNLYPHTTHTFIRREIDGVEFHGIEVERMSLRTAARELPTADDRAERDRTVGVLELGVATLFARSIRIAITRPIRFVRTLWWATRLGWRSYSGLLRHLAYFVESCAVLVHVRRRGITHIHAHFGTNATTVAMFVTSLGGPPFSFMIHGPGEWNSPEHLHIPEKVAAAKFVTVISCFARAQTYRWSQPADWPKVHVVRCGVDGSFLDAAPSPVPDVNRLLMVARLGPPKGHGILLQALSRLKEEGVDFHMTLIGDGPLRGYIEQEIQTRRLEGSVEVAGWMDNQDVHQALLESRAFVLPSFSEGLPVSIMEAMVLGRPIVSTRIAGIAELVVDGESGWLVNAGSVEELTDALRAVLSATPERLTDMGTAGRVAVLAKHDSRNEAKRLVELLRTGE